MKIEDLIKEIGSRHTKVQFLNSCIRSSTTNKKDVTTISFITDVKTNDIRADRKGAIIIWADNKRINRAWNKLSKKKQVAKGKQSAPGGKR